MDKDVVLLIECVNRDAYHPHPNELFPFIQGFLRQIGRKARWVRLGLGTRPDQLEPQLPKEAMDRVLKILESSHNSHVILNLKVARESHKVLSAKCSKLMFLESEHSILYRKTLWRIFDWLGGVDSSKEDREKNAIEIVDPDYTTEILWKHEDLPPRIFEIHTGQVCSYRKPLWKNAFFAPLDFKKEDKFRGCAFCGIEPLRSPLFTDPVDLALRQIRSVLKTTTDESPEFLFTSAGIFKKLDILFDSLFQQDLRPSTFHFSCRIDDFLKMTSKIEKVLPVLKKFGHKLAIQQIGLENFSPQENDRFNKGVSPEQIERSMLEFDRLEVEFPENFFFHKYGGFGFILFTPWTTLDDLRINCDKARKFKIKETGFFLRTRLQLLPHTPLTLLAKHDGLLIADNEEPTFFSGCIRHADTIEIPWRFQQPLVSLIAVVVRRLSRNPDIEVDDPIVPKIQNFLLKLPMSMLDHLSIFDLVLSTAEEANPEDLEILLEESIKRSALTDLRGSGRVSGNLLTRGLSLLCKKRPDLFHGYYPKGISINVPEIELCFAKDSKELNFTIAWREKVKKWTHLTQNFALRIQNNGCESEEVVSQIVFRLGEVIEKFGDK